MAHPPLPLVPLLRRGWSAVAARLGLRQSFATLMRTARGGITVAEGNALAEAARSVRRGAVVEIGSFRGKSGVALAHGLRGSDRPIYCIDPHEAFVGALGGQFGPEDRAAFFRTMLASGAYQRVRLINLPAAQVARCWDEPIGMLFIDGDHRYEAVRDDFELWYPRVVAGGIIAFDDTHVEELGPCRLLRELLPDRRLRFVRKVGKITFLEKLEQLAVRAQPGRSFLVACHDLKAAGGLLRFERVGRELAERGHRLAWVRLGDGSRDEFRSAFPVLTMAEAAAMRWNATFVPGQGFPRTTVERLAEFAQPRFGQRVQHVLNDQSLRDGFLEVNARFQPHAVVFNNRHWQPGSYTDFAADRFAVIEGAIDAARFAGTRRREDAGFHVGGVSKASMHGFWREFARAMPAEWTLHLFGGDPEITDARGRVEYVGRLGEDELPEFYARLDAVAHAERFAGWANVVAEAMAAGVPVVCTQAGTLAFAEHGRTARVVSGAPDDVVAQLRWIEQNPDEAAAMAERAALGIRAFDWVRYTDALLRVAEDDGRSHYTLAPELGMHGKWPLQNRLEGLDGILPLVRGRSVLDLGCAEGHVARACYDHGADVVHGFDLDGSRVAAALTLNPEPRACLASASLVPWREFAAAQPTLRAAYDSVFCLGVLQHLPARERRPALLGALARCRDLFVVRAPARTWEQDDIDATVRAAGFEVVSASEASLASQGGLRAYRRAVADPDLARPELRFVSFPKSGRTWIRYALTALGVADRVTFEHDGFEYNDGGRPALDFDPSPRVAKCHRADRVVYMSRDPRDVIVSLYHQVTERFRDYFGYAGDIHAFLRDPYFGAHNLAGFQRMWRKMVDAGLATHVTYEAAHADFEGTLRTVLTTFGLECDDAAIRAAAEAAQFDNMKAVESSATFAEPWLRPRNDAPKVRRGKVGGFRAELSAADREFLDELFGDLIAPAAAVDEAEPANAHEPALSPAAR